MGIRQRFRGALQAAVRRFGYDLRRFPDPGRSDELWEAWARKLANAAPIRTVFDVGANRGQTIKWFRPLMPDAHIHAFEPYEPAFRDLCEAVRDDPRVTPVRMALGDRRGEATLFQNAADSTNSLLPNSADTGRYTPDGMAVPRGQSTVPVERLDQYCERAGLTTLDVLKVDAQGFERRILEGAGDRLHPDRIRGLYLELLFVNYYDGQAWGGEILELLRKRGYRLFGFAGVAFDPADGWRWADAMFVGD